MSGEKGSSRCMSRNRTKKHQKKIQQGRRVNKTCLRLKGKKSCWLRETRESKNGRMGSVRGGKTPRGGKGDKGSPKNPSKRRCVGAVGKTKENRQMPPAGRKEKGRGRPNSERKKLLRQEEKEEFCGNVKEEQKRGGITAMPWARETKREASNIRK